MPLAASGLVHRVELLTRWEPTARQQLLIEAPTTARDREPG